MLSFFRLVYKDGNKIYDPKKRQYKCKSIPATDWNEQTKAEKIRKSVYSILRQEQREQQSRRSRIWRDNRQGDGDSQHLPRRPVLDFH